MTGTRRGRAEDVVQETLHRAWQYPEMTDKPEGVLRAWLFTVARKMIVEDRRTARFRNESLAPDPEGTDDGAGLNELDAALR